MGETRNIMYSELHCKTNFSFLSGASHADELVERAIEMGYQALAITDENTLAGVVRAHSAARAANEAAAESAESKQNFKLIIGAEVIFNDALPALLWATDRASYGRLSKLITVGRRRAPKAECWLSFDDLANHHEGLLVGVLPHLRASDLVSITSPQTTRALSGTTARMRMLRFIKTVRIRRCKSTANYSVTELT